jgi:hypothetical protein
LPASGEVAMAPFNQAIKAMNEWIPISEAFVAWELWIGFRIVWAGTKILIRVFTFGFAGRE